MIARMRGRPKVVVATGRFQMPIHLGHLEYLEEARSRAVSAGAKFVVLTGPYDHERGPSDRLLFAERRELLVTLLGLDSDCVLNHGGSPHGGPDAVNAWATGFFRPIDDIACSHDIELVIVRKAADIKDYGTGVPRHYSEVLLDACNHKFAVWDVTDRMSKIHLSSRDLRGISSWDAGAVPAAVREHFLHATREDRDGRRNSCDLRPAA